MLLFFLSSGLFLGWSLGANDAANVFGTAVGSRMIRFKTAAIICGIFVVVGAVIGGSGTSETLGKLGAINALSGAFTVALSAALAIFMMVKMKLPVSSSQAIVGAIIGWNIFAGKPTDSSLLTKIVGTWIICPVLSASIAALLYILIRSLVNRSHVHLLRQDQFTRYGLIIVGAFGAYSLGANNIANVVGVFVPSSPLHSLSIPHLGVFSGTRQLFLLGGLSIAIGVATYSKGVMETVGSSVVKLSPLAALIVVLAESTVLFIFASKGLNGFLTAHGLPPIPLVPISSSQAAVGALVGIGLVRGGKGIHYSLLGKISIGWITTPVLASIIAFITLFFMQNVFNQTVVSPPVKTAQQYISLTQKTLNRETSRNLLHKEKSSSRSSFPGTLPDLPDQSGAKNFMGLTGDQIHSNVFHELVNLKGFCKKTISAGLHHPLFYSAVGKTGQQINPDIFG